MLTVAEGTLDTLGAELEAGGYEVEERPLLTFAPPADWRPLLHAFDQLESFNAVAFTSPRAASAFVEQLRAWVAQGGRPPARLPPAWATGQATSRIASGIWADVQVAPPRERRDQGAAQALALAMLESGVHGDVLFPCGDLRREELAETLRDAGLHVSEVVCYRTVLGGEAAALAAAERADVLVVGSPSVADLLARAVPEPDRPLLVAIGPTTALGARASGWIPDAVAGSPTVGAVMQAVREAAGA